MIRILLAEDNDSLRELVHDYLVRNGFEVEAKADGLSAWEAMQEMDFQLVLLDIMMPEMDGFELCRRIREKENVPILFLTARVQEEDQLRGYRLGADDYIMKPFSLPVLLAKCRVILERMNYTGEWLEAGAIRLSPGTHCLSVGGDQVELQTLDFQLLQYFMQNQGRALSREQILVKVWGFDYEGSERSVDTHVKNLRKALGRYGKYIRTIVKVGYVFETGGESFETETLEERQTGGRC
ncbi:MAG: response regulator transcription factor [Eubacterium sp.]|nr:response regulator transcription factor [Eubacterium sp.]